MIVGINYNTDGSRYISTVAYGADWTTRTESIRATHFLDECDEVYIINFNSNYQLLIDEVVLKGCRIGV